MPNPLRSPSHWAPARHACRPHSPISTSASLLLLAIALSAGGCSAPSRASAVAVDRWLTCEECNNGELAAVLASGAQAFGPLRERLLTGPDPSKLHRLENGLAQRAHRLQDSVPLPPNHVPPAHGQLTVDEQRYVDTFLSNYTAIVEKRAALALAKIGGPEAKALLQQAGTLNLRSDVHTFIVFAHDSLWVP
jgi:hypothetical protein